MTPTEAKVFVPTRRQRQIWDTVKAAPRGSLTLIGYGGAAGGGKTRALSERMKAMREAERRVGA